MLKVPPPVGDLRLTLRCPHLRRDRTRLSMRVLRRAKGSAVLLARVRFRRARPVGFVTFRAGRRQLGEAVVDSRTGVASISARVASRHVTATYSGDASNAPSRARS